MLASDFTKGDVLIFRSSAMLEKMSSSGNKAMRLAFAMVLLKVLGTREYFHFYLNNLENKSMARGANAANRGKNPPGVVFYV